MSEVGTDANSETELFKREPCVKENNEENRMKETVNPNKKKKSRKSVFPKIQPEIRQEPETSNEKQTLLTDIWKPPSTFSESKPLFKALPKNE